MMREAPEDRPNRRNPLLLPVRLLLYWLVKGLVLLFLGCRFLLRPRVVRYSLLIILVVGAVAWKSASSLAFLPWSTPAPEHALISEPAGEQLQSPAVAEQYFKSQAAYDASGMWENMSEAFRKRMTTAGSSPEQLQRELDSARQQQRRYTSLTYVGGVSLGESRVACFYVLTVETPTGTSRLPYTLVLDPDGKINNVQWSLDR